MGASSGAPTAVANARPATTMKGDTITSHAAAAVAAAITSTVLSACRHYGYTLLVGRF
jgi:mRNA-degrading endonuclease toxin of MazEF toxin-antitoxin module